MTAAPTRGQVALEESLRILKRMKDRSLAKLAKPALEAKDKPKPAPSATGSWGRLPYKED